MNKKSLGRDGGARPPRRSRGARTTRLDAPRFLFDAAARVAIPPSRRRTAAFRRIRDDENRDGRFARVRFDDTRVPRRRARDQAEDRKNEGEREDEEDVEGTPEVRYDVM